MPKRRKFVIIAILIAAVGLSVVAITHTAGEPTTNQPTITISPKGQELLTQVRDAYAGLKTLAVSSKISGQFDIDGVQHTNQGEDSGVYTSNGLFRNEMKEKNTDDPAATQPASDALIGNTGEKVYLFLPLRNRYVIVDTPKEKLTLDTLGPDLADIIRNQNMSMALALSGDAATEIKQDASTIDRANDVKIDGQTYPALTVTHPRFDLTIAIDPQTHLVRRAVADMTKNAKLMGAKEIKQAELTMDFENSFPAAITSDQFAWAPPPGSQELTAAGAPSEFDGKPVPSFDLQDMNGKHITPASLKGSVFVMDFWATWCGPCVAGLPQVDAIYKDVKDKGVKIFAVNQQEEKSAVQKFVDDTKLSIPVLLDPDGKVCGIFDPDQTIPFTLVVGKDGKVIKAALMGGHEEELRGIIDTALKQ